VVVLPTDDLLNQKRLLGSCVACGRSAYAKLGLTRKNTWNLNSSASWLFRLLKGRLVMVLATGLTDVYLFFEKLFCWLGSYSVLVMGLLL